MYIGGVISHLGGWQLLKAQYIEVLDDIKEVLACQHVIGGDSQFSLRDLSQSLEKAFYSRKWDLEVPLYSNTKRLQRKWLIDCIKEKVGLEICFGRHWQLQSYLFVNMPLYVRVGQIKIAIFLVPMKQFTLKMLMGAVSFEYVEELLTELSPLPLKYPFVVIGISPEEREYSCVELTSDIDNFLINEIGYSLEDVILLGEQPNCDFKENLPESKKLAGLICGFANITGGGLILLGLTDNGDIVGVSSYELDNIKLKIVNVARSSCNPIPKMQFHDFVVPTSSDSRILVVRVSELDIKPCVVAGRAFIRVGPSVRIATPEEIRSMILK